MTFIFTFKFPINFKKDIMEFFIMDDGFYPKTNSAEFQQGVQRQIFHPRHILQGQFLFYKADPTDLAKPFSDFHCKKCLF